VEALLTERVAVQLKHDEQETTWENHGFVRIIDAHGRVIAESADYQHNPFSRTCADRTAALMATAKEVGFCDAKAGDDCWHSASGAEASGAVETDPMEKEPASSDSDSTKAPSDGGIIGI